MGLFGLLRKFETLKKMRPLFVNRCSCFALFENFRVLKMECGFVFVGFGFTPRTRVVFGSFPF